LLASWCAVAQISWPQPAGSFVQERRRRGRERKQLRWRDVTGRNLTALRVWRRTRSIGDRSRAIFLRLGPCLDWRFFQPDE
jgi:hypothetical protein